jgi:DNA-binding transcriptional regulator YhcF (GntR family)
MESESSLINRLRYRIVNALHLGDLHAGGRLPSIREISQETGTDHRAVANAYRTLEAEGLVQVRGRSGVYVAPQERFGGELLAETARWMAGVLTEA